MQIVRIAESTELNNAFIVGIVAICALVAIWLIVALSSLLIRQAALFLRVRTFQLFIDGYGRKARLAAVITSFVLAIAGAAVMAYTLSEHKDLQPVADELLAKITEDAL